MAHKLSRWVRTGSDGILAPPHPPLPKWETPERVSGPDTEVTLCLPFSLLFRQVIFPRRSRGGVAYRYYGKILFEVILVPLRDFLSAV